MREKTYSQLMDGGNSYISIKLDLNEPVEITDFAAMFAGIGSQFDEYLARDYPDLKGKARMYVREVRQGSIIADIFAELKDLIGVMDATLIVLGFSALFSDRIRALISGRKIDGAKKSDIKEIGETIRAVSNDNGGSMSIESVTYKNNVWETNLEIKFDSFEARKANQTLEIQKQELDAIEHVDFSRVLMVFERSRKSDTKLDQTGELVVISEVNEKPKALIYGSELLEQKIKHEIREADDNIYKKGFVVDANARMRDGRTVAYVVTKVHQIIDLPDD